MPEAEHLYQPLLHLSKSQLVEVSPVSLNEGERDFVLDLRKFHEDSKDFFKDRELFLLRKGMTKPELQKCHVLFQRDDKETYIKTLLTTVAGK